MRVGIFGGTFDPPHLGHLILAAEAREQLALDLLLWVLTPTPPHKLGRPVSPVALRLDLVEAALGGDAAFQLSRVELDRPGPHYAVDTVRLVAAQYAQAEIFYLIGGDSLADLPTWHAPQDFLAACDGLGVMRRPADEVDLAALEQVLPGLGAKLHFIQTPQLEIASHEIRERIAAGRHYRYFVPERVYERIQQKGYYLLG